MLKRHFLAAGAVASLFISGSAFAQSLSIEAYATVSSTISATGTTTASLPANSKLGIFTVVTAAGAQGSVANSFDLASLSVSSTNTTTSNQVLTIFLTESGQTAPTSGTLNVSTLNSESVTFTGATAASDSVTFTSLLSSANAVYAGTAVGSSTFTGSGAFSATPTSSASTGSSLFSSTIEVQVTVKPGDSVNIASLDSTFTGTAGTKAVPEPSSALPLGMAVALLGFLFQRKKMAAADLIG